MIFLIHKQKVSFNFRCLTGKLMITLHHLRIGRSLFCAWLLEELHLEYELKEYFRNPKTFRSQDDLKSVHPLGKSPIIEDGSLMLTESSAITTYLMEKYDSENEFHPCREKINTWAKYTQWLHYPEGSAFAPLLIDMLLQRTKDSSQRLNEFSSGEIVLHLNYIQEELDNNDYMLGNFSAADISIAYVIGVADTGKHLAPYPKLLEYQTRCKNRAAFQKAKLRVVE